MTPELIELGRLQLARIAVSPMDNNVYLLTSLAEGEQLLIDAAAEPEAISEVLAASGGRLAKVVTTHAHADHFGALAAVRAANPGVAILAGAADAAVVTASTGVVVDTALQHGDVIRLGDVGLDVIGLRGHTPGSVAIACSEPGHAPQLFTGDSLFPGGVGNTGGDPRRFATLLDEVSTRIFDRYPDETVVWPGHGKPTTLGAERPQLAQWRSRGW